MNDPKVTSAARVEEGNQVRVGRRWLVCEEVESEGEEVTLWFEEIPYRLPADTRVMVVS